VRGVRAVTIGVAALSMVALVGGCGGGSSKTTLAAQDQLVQLSNQLAQIHSQYAAAQRRLTQARRAVARVRNTGVVETRSAAGVAATSVTTPKRARRSFVLTIDTLCSPVRFRAAKGPERRALQLLERRRRQALYELNLSCRAEGA